MGKQGDELAASVGQEPPDQLRVVLELARFHASGARVGSISAERYPGKHKWLTFSLVDEMEGLGLVETWTTPVVGFEASGWPVDVWVKLTAKGWLAAGVEKEQDDG